MGAYSEYLGRKWNFQELTAERKLQLKRISSLRKRDVLVIASDQSKGAPHISVSFDYSDILPVQDQLTQLTGDKLDIIIETPGGIAEVAEDIVRVVRSKYETVGMIVPGWAKSAGTIFVMAGDEILMGTASALGPIDPQLPYSNGKRISADAVLDGLDKIKEEVLKTGQLNQAYIPILQNYSPGEIQRCINAREFSQRLVREWLVKYKFKFWEKHETSGTVVTSEQKAQRAKEIAKGLCQHSKWLTHARSISMTDLEQMKVKVTNYELDPELNDAISRYYALLRLSFEMTGMYKIFETPSSQVMRFLQGPQPVQNTLNANPLSRGAPQKASIPYVCPKCKKTQKIQANFSKNIPLEPDHILFPQDNMFSCPGCGMQGNLQALRLSIESQTKSKIQ